MLFINISFNAFCQYSEQAFFKLRFLFESIKDEEMYLLWWRPHPKLEVDLQNFDERLFDRYVELKQEYIRGEYGVFEQVESFDYVMQIADIYYGDGGTVVQEFTKLGKRVIYPNYTGVFFPIGICKQANHIYGTDHDSSSIVRYDIQNGEWEYVTLIERAYGVQKAFHKSVAIGDDIWFIPFMTDYLVKYNVRNKSISVIDLNINPKKLGERRTRFWAFYYYNDVLYLIPASYSSVLAVEMTANRVVEVFDLSEAICQNQIITWLSWKELDPGVLALVSMHNNQVLILDFNNFTTKLLNVGNKKYKFNDISKKGDSVYIVVKNKPVILEWNYKEGVVSEIQFDESRFGEYGITVFDDYATYIFNDKLYCFPAMSLLAYSINLITKEIEHLAIFDRYLKDDIVGSQFDTVTIADGKMYVQSWQYKFLTFDFETEKVIRESECKLPLSDVTRLEIDLIKHREE